MLLMVGIPALITVALALGIWWWTPLYDRRPTLRLLATLVTLSAFIIWLQLSLGIFRLLTPFNLRTLSIAVIVVLHAGYFLWGRKRLAAKCDPIGRPSKTALALAVLVAIVYAWQAWVASLVTPTGWDSLTYHLTQIFYLARSHSVEIFPLLPGRAVQFHFPHVGEYHASWTYILSGSAAESYRVGAYGLMWLTLTFGVATRAAVEALGMKKALPWIVPIIMLTPGMLEQPIELYVDTVFAAFVVAAVAFGLWASREARYSHLLMTALAAGLALGTKVSFLYFSLPIFGVLISAAVGRAILSGGVVKATLRVVLLLGVFSIGFGFWLGRNFVNTGNPFWPTRLELGGITVFRGPVSIPHGPQTAWYVSSHWNWFTYPFHETHRGKTEYKGNGLGPLFAVGYVALFFLLPAAAFVGNWAVFRALLTFPLTIAPFVTISPTAEPRYAYALVGFAVIALAIAVEIIARGWRAVMIPGASSNATANRAPFVVAQLAMAVALLFSAAGCIVSTSDDMPRVLERWRAGTWDPQQYYAISYGRAGDAFNWITNHGGPNVTYTFTNTTFIAPMFGWHNRNRVVYTSLPGDPKTAPHQMRVSSYEAWRKFLFDQKVTYIVEWVPWWGETSDKLTEQWIRENPADFQIVEDFGRTRIWRPLFHPGSTLSVARTALKGMDDSKEWKLEYKTAGVTTSAQGSGVIDFTYDFPSRENDYCDWRYKLLCDDWSRASRVTFDISGQPQPAFLIVYLKNTEASEASRYRVDLRKLSGDTIRVGLPLQRPEWHTARWNLEDVCEIHVVLDDVDDAAAPKGEFKLSNFRLEFL